MTLDGFRVQPRNNKGCSSNASHRRYNRIGSAPFRRLSSLSSSSALEEQTLSRVSLPVKRVGFQYWWCRVQQSALLYGVLATGIRVGANIVLLPLVLSRLSQSELALWWVFLALGAFANLADFGFGQAITRVYGYLWAGAEDFDAEGLRSPPETGTPNLPRIRQLNRIVHYLYWRLSIAAALLLGVGGTVFLLKPMRTFEQPVHGWFAWAAFLVIIGYSLGTSHWALACQGINRVRELQGTYLWSGLAYVATTAAMLLLGLGLPAVVIGTATKAAVARFFNFRTYRKAVPETGGDVVDLSILARLWPNARKFGVIAVGSYLISNGNVLICSQFLGNAVTASFGLTVQVGSFLMNFAALWLAVKWPLITILRTQGRLEEMAILFARRLALAVASFLVMAVVLVLAGTQLLEWKGSETRLLSTPQLIVYLFYLAQQLVYVQFGILTFTENIVPFFKISLLTGVGLICLSLLLTPGWGVWGLLVAPLIAEFSCSTWYPVIRGFRGQPLSPRQFIKAAVFGRL